MVSPVDLNGYAKMTHLRKNHCQSVAFLATQHSCGSVCLAVLASLNLWLNKCYWPMAR